VSKKTNILKQFWADPVGRGVTILGAIYIGSKFVGWMRKDRSGGTTHNLPETEDYNTPRHGHTYSPNQYALFADQIEAAWLSGPFGITEDDTAIGNILMQMMNDNDVVALSNAFGTRHVHGLWFLSGGNLAQIIHKYLDNDIKAIVNADYEAKGMTSRWL
jgi:hypothetical protein